MNTQRGYLQVGRFKLAYRGFKIRPFVRTTPIRIGSTRLHCVGPVALFVEPKR